MEVFCSLFIFFLKFLLMANKSFPPKKKKKKSSRCPSDIFSSPCHPPPSANGCATGRHCVWIAGWPGGCTDRARAQDPVWLHLCQRRCCVSEAGELLQLRGVTRALHHYNRCVCLFCVSCELHVWGVCSSSAQNAQTHTVCVFSGTAVYCDWRKWRRFRCE